MFHFLSCSTVFATWFRMMWLFHLHGTMQPGVQKTNSRHSEVLDRQTLVYKANDIKCFNHCTMQLVNGHQVYVWNEVLRDQKRDDLCPVCRSCYRMQLHVLCTQWGQVIPIHQSLEQRKVYCRTMQGDGWLMSSKPRTPQRVSAKHF